MVMRIKRYEAEERELPKIIRQIRRDLGENAVVKTRRFKKGGVLGIGGKSMVEVFAGVDRDLEAEARDMAANPPRSSQALLDRLLPNATTGVNGYGSVSQNGSSVQPVIYQPPGMSPAISPSPSQTQTATVREDSIQKEIKKLAQEIADIKRTLEEGSQIDSKETQTVEIKYPRWLSHVREKLIENEIDDTVADLMLNETLQNANPEALTDFEATLAAFQRTIAGTIEARGVTKGGQNPRVLALAGPTGVGKTTTLAKLAATANLLDGKKVGLISADTYRIAAIDQLKTFAGILDIPLKVVFSSAELREALKEYSGMDRIFIDTAGRSPNDDDRMEELRELVAAHEDVECHLVVSATTRPKDMKLVCERFRPANYTRFIFTKIDETMSLGPVLSLMYSEGLPASYLTNG
ncbi:MAG TPA: flagellar biosynthesis protein FlhF, partial [Firmicutes bacterium]|nr:flagellar biosynthesis protein FlhF [Bacillota bacterium]